MSLPRFLLFGSKEQKNADAVEPRAVQVAPSGGMKVWLDGMRNTFTVATSAIISSLPNVTVASMPSLTVGSAPALTANPTRHSLLTKDLLAGTDTTFLIAAANYRDVIIYLMNVDTAARTVTIALAASITDTNVLCKTMPCEVGCRIPICLPALSTGQTLCGLCDSASKVAVEVWGIPI